MASSEHQVMPASNNVISGMKPNPIRWLRPASSSSFVDTRSFEKSSYPCSSSSSGKSIQVEAVATGGGPHGDRYEGSELSAVRVVH
ncbi:hypothetical protein STEG23_024392, partial [Scotinomys teguina]